jgi:hypothetical protein
MSDSVAIGFECLPLRSIVRWDSPWDASIQQRMLWSRIRNAVLLHGELNSYYLFDGACRFQLTNDPDIGLLRFAFEGTILTDAEDLRTRATFLSVELASHACDWLTGSALRWLEESVKWAVRVEFDEYLASGDLRRTAERLERLEAEQIANQGYLCMGL